MLNEFAAGSYAGQSMSFNETKQLVLKELREIMKQMPVDERGKPTIFIDPPGTGFSILSLIREVQRADQTPRTAVGNAFIYREAERLGILMT